MRSLAAIATGRLRFAPDTCCRRLPRGTARPHPPVSPARTGSTWRTRRSGRTSAFRRRPLARPGSATSSGYWPDELGQGDQADEPRTLPGIRGGLPALSGTEASYYETGIIEPPQKSDHGPQLPEPLGSRGNSETSARSGADELSDGRTKYWVEEMPHGHHAGDVRLVVQRRPHRRHRTSTAGPSPGTGSGIPTTTCRPARW